MAQDDEKTIMRSLGEFFGHIVRGVRADQSSRPRVREVSREIEEEERDGVVLRRTTIEEIEVHDSAELESAAEDAAKKRNEHS